MAETYELIVKGGRIATPGGIVETDLGVKDGRIAVLGDLDPGRGEAVLDAAGLHVLPGVIDTQVHFREPGLEHKEDLASGTAAAALGGVTAVFEMPNTKPSTLDAADLDDKLSRARGRTWTDHAFFIGAAAENAESLGEVERLPGCAGVKVFMGSSTGSLLVEDDETLLEVLRNGRRRVAIHAEDEARLRERLALVRGGAAVDQHPVWRDEETALRATRRILALARRAGRRIHVLHVTTAEELPLLAAHKDVATVEVTPQHLTLAAPDCYERLGTLAQMNPPIRAAHHRDALWQALGQGIVDVIGSDHAPHSREEKAGDYPATPSGMPGVQTLLPLLLDHMNAGRLSLERLVDLTSAGPQRIYGVAGKGRIAAGYDADLTLVDLKARREITGAWLASKCGWSPFEGVTVAGWPAATVVRGRVVMRDDELQGVPAGQPVRFLETLAPAE
ncbi:MAG: dihydroorotase [Rhodospirillales bacterium]|nr:dihydroorotase [Rhodospirillales bacterium]MDH3791467.1 dihydroorotase [Rhodospirillales bacterium]MDH3910789.1 dihydroorotase [Rhodospirillales bacterium]